MNLASTIRQGMIDRGLPDHIADGFMLNFQDESGLDPGIVEHVPNVHGTRGFGLYQLTGPRRTAYEAFAAERGVEPANVDAQLDWLMYELQGPEAAAAKHIFAAQDTGTAADAIVRKFLRPAAEHRESRSARYLGGKARVPTSAPQSAPQPASIPGPARGRAAPKPTQVAPPAVPMSPQDRMRLVGENLMAMDRGVEAPEMTDQQLAAMKEIFDRLGKTKLAKKTGLFL